MTDEVRAWWDATADYFQDEADLDVAVDWTGYHDGDLDLLGDVEGVETVELGCGGGQMTVALAERGARVMGVDLSAEQLSHARRLADERGVDAAFVRGDVTDLPLADDGFDLAVNSWVLQWVPDLDACFAEAHRVLRPGGRLVFLRPHPFHDVVDADGRVAESYFDTGRRATGHEGIDADRVLYRHTVSGVVNALVESGFAVERLHEPGTDDPADYADGPWGEYVADVMARVPHVLVVEARA